MPPFNPEPVYLSRGLNLSRVPLNDVRYARSSGPNHYCTLTVFAPLYYWRVWSCFCGFEEGVLLRYILTLSR